MTLPACARIRAGGLPAPGYMGLASAHHVYLVREDRGFGWPCFGRGFSEGDEAKDLGTFEIFIDWAAALAAPETGEQYLAGVANTVNGTCHTIANRLLALSENEHSSVKASVDDAYSVAVFGKYGYGTKQYCELLAESAQKVSVPPDLLGLVVKKVQEPFEDELYAWCTVISSVLPARNSIDPVSVAKIHAPLKEAGLQVVATWCRDRDAIYETHFDHTGGRAPEGSEIAAIRKDLAGRALETVKNVEDSLEVAHLITSGQRKELDGKIGAFVRQFGSVL